MVTAEDFKLVSYRDSISATSHSSGRTPYITGAEMAFLEIIEGHLNAPENEKVYANCLSVVQSSGTGKSRMLHEVGKHVYTVIMNIRAVNAGGFPFPDLALHLYFLSVATQHEAYLTYYKFLVALFNEVTRTLTDPANAVRNAEDFQKFLGYGQESQVTRDAFFKRVINAAIDMQEVATPPGSTVAYPSIRIKKKSDHTETENALDAAAEELSHTIARLSSTVEPSLSVKLVLCLDEAHEMAATWAGSEGAWSPFSEFRRVLLSIRKWPFFGVFLSTTGSITKFQPVKEDDKSNRIQSGELQLLPPYYHVGFDQLAQPVSPKDNLTLDHVTDPEFMIRLGRPLFGTRYENGSSSIKKYIIDFARQKLLNGNFTSDNLRGSRSLAILAMRIPLEFNSTTFKGRAEEELHVERHMRICLGVKPDSEVMMTVSPSEPVLAEAAAMTMQGAGFNCARILNHHLKRTYLPKGDRGEVVTMLLLLMSHDSAISPEPGRIMPYHQPVPVLKFLQKLFARQHHDTLLSYPLSGRPTNLTVEDAFKDSWLHFSHFVKVKDFEGINRKFLWRMMVRGAAVLCATHHAGVNVIIPFCYRGKKLCEENTSAIIGQSKNVPALDELLQALFAAMDPTVLGVFNPLEDASKLPPVIKVVFSLGSIPERFSVRTSCTHSQSVDIFASGVSHEIFGPIQEADEKTWRTVLSRTNFDADGDEETSTGVIARTMNPCASDNESNWTGFAPLG